MACFHCSELSFGSCCELTKMPKSKLKKGRTTEGQTKSRATLRREGNARELADNHTFTCPTCGHNVTRARNLRYHMCEMHSVWCETLQQTASFPQPDFVLRIPTAEEYAIYGQGKPLQTLKVKDRPVPNRVIYDDISKDDIVPNVPTVAVDAAYNDPTLAQVRLRSYPAAAAGSATQTSELESLAPIRYSTHPLRRDVLTGSQT